MLRATGYLSCRLSPARFSRRLSALADHLALLLDVLGALFACGQAAIADIVIDRHAHPSLQSLARRAAARCRGTRLLQLLSGQAPAVLRLALGA